MVPSLASIYPGPVLKPDVRLSCASFGARLAPIGSDFPSRRGSKRELPVGSFITRRLSSEEFKQQSYHIAWHIF